MSPESAARHSDAGGQNSDPAGQSSGAGEQDPRAGGQYPEAGGQHPEAIAASADPAGKRAEVAGPQAGVAATSPAEEAATRQAAQGAAPAVLDEAQRPLLRAVLNRIVPARTDLPGAGDLDVGASIEQTLAASSRLRRLFLEGLTQIAITAQQHAGADFESLPVPSQIAVLEAVEQRAPAFFVALVEHTYRGYYTLVAVQRAVGFDARPPQPLGHELPPFDPALLAQQRKRAPFWRADR